MSEHEVDLIVARLRDELGKGAGGAVAGDSNGFGWAARAQAEGFWAVSADRPFLYKPGTWGRIRGLLLVPPKVVLRKLMRWYVEPALGLQREFNSSILKALDQFSEHVDAAWEELRVVQEELRGELGDELRGVQQELRGVQQQLLVRLEDVGAQVGGLERATAEADQRLVRLERRFRGAKDPVTAAGAEAARPTAPAAGDLPDYFAFEARMRGSRELIRVRQSPYVDEFRDHVPVLDVGCGRGEFLELLRAAGLPARGIDLDPDMVEHCRHEGLDVVQAEAVAYLEKLEEGSLGGIFCAHIVEHLAPPVLFRLLELAAAKLRPGGLFVAETPNPLSLYALANFTSDLSHERPLHPQTLQFLTRQAGFRETELRFFSAPSEKERLRRVPLPPEPMFDPAREALDANVGRLNEVVFGPQDYAVFAQT